VVFLMECNILKSRLSCNGYLGQIHCLYTLLDGWLLIYVDILAVVSTERVAWV